MPILDGVIEEVVVGPVGLDGPEAETPPDGCLGAVEALLFAVFVEMVWRGVAAEVSDDGIGRRDEAGFEGTSGQPAHTEQQ